ncbi:uncharacterized protein LOC105200169 [Solenopsis invicta]|uniref:uncharacterized protein LOC105200169 n=1 Tax=Solenopsis invicta TaxID=13686 RepID=UPI0005963163|nr:uncharacterized protein LOC105200169 [Solenopsis invicta]
MTEDLESLKRQRTTLKGRATKFKNFLEANVDSNENRLVLESRLEKYNDLWHEYQVLQNKIDAKFPEADIAERERFEDAFFIIQATAQSKLGHTTITNAQTNIQVENITAPTQMPVRLPVISLPTFSGNYEQWQQFHDIFKALVHDNARLDSVQKFHYLQSALSGSEAQVIHSLQTTNENYPTALELLTKRFQNVRLTIHHHVHELFNTPFILKESAESLRVLTDNFQKHLRVLQQLKESVDKWDTLIIYLITSKLDSVTKKEWELKVIQEKASTTKQLVKFLNTQCEFLKALQSVHTKTTPAKVVVQKTTQNNASKGQGTILAYIATNEADVCVFCKQAHKIYTCKIFKELSIESQRNETKRLNHCYNCLGSNHTTQKCTSRICRHCSKKHHTLLHMHDKTNASDQTVNSPNNTFRKYRG